MKIYFSKYRILPFIFILFFCSDIALCQWSRTFDLQKGNEYGIHMSVREDGVIVLVNGLCDLNSTFCQGLMKMDFEGNLLWKNIIFYDTLTTNHFESMVIRNDTIFVNVNYYSNPPNCSILAFDLQGNYLTRWDYGEPGGQNGTYWARDIATDGNRMFVSYQYRKLAGGYMGKASVFSHEWQLLWEMEMPNLYYNDIEATGDGGMASIHTVCYPCKAYVRRYDADGSLIWQTQVPDLTEDNDGGAGRVAFLSNYPDGGFIGIWPLDTFAIYLYSSPQMVFKIDAQGQMEWQKVAYTQLRQELYGLFPTQNGDIVVSGLDQNLTGIQSDSDFYYGGYVSRLNAAGETLWERRIFDIAKGQAAGWLYDGQELPDGSLIFCGEMYDTLPEDPYPSNVWLLRLDSAGCLTPGCGINEFLLDAGEAAGTAQKTLFTAFPVPFREHLYLAAVLGAHIPPGDYQVALFDALGRLTLEKSFYPQFMTELDIGAAPHGAYSLVIRHDGQIIQTIPVVKKQ